ncbi:uncharacterized protein [Drosophila bipectinata]|uniref:uncharacterized protein n=1 Tax=Drosophila bipectinata TaxID=42026 RepID=UPI001C88FD20|nr:uncharacterized protein LOC108132181 [Drosophila bipectinata]KAH8275597.1 hypothetical protein KR026_011363 [Drosophila bipectinata]
MPNEDAERSGPATGAIKENEVPPAEPVKSVSASASSASTTPPPSHEEENNGEDGGEQEPGDDEDEEQLLSRMRADAVGDTMYSSRFILQTMMQLNQLTPDSQLDQQLEDDLCKVWDMSTSPEVVSMLLENDAVDSIMYTIISACEDVRLYEILVGLLGNLCAQVDCAVLLTSNPEFMETLFKMANCMDTGMLVQLMRLYQFIMAHVLSGKEQFAVDWYVCFAAFENSAANLGKILQQSVSDELLTAALKATNAILASCALVEEENSNSALNLKPFSEVFLVQELCNGVNIAFLRLMRDDQSKLSDEEAGAEEGEVPAAVADSGEDADVGYETCAPKISCDVEIIQTYLNICTILVQLPEAQNSMDIYAPNIVSCLTRILQFLQQPLQLFPMGERQEEYLEDLAHIWSRIKYFYQTEAFTNLLEVWFRLKKHIDNYTENDEEDVNDFEDEEEEDVPKEQYVDNALKVLRLLACMLIKAGSIDLQGIGEEKLQLFMSSLKAEEDAIFSSAFEVLNEVLENETSQGQA